MRGGLRTQHRPHRNHREAALKRDSKTKDPSERASCHHHTRRRDHRVATINSPETERPSPKSSHVLTRDHPYKKRPSFRLAPSEASPEPNPPPRHWTEELTKHGPSSLQPPHKHHSGPRSTKAIKTQSGQRRNLVHEQRLWRSHTPSSSASTP